MDDKLLRSIASLRFTTDMCLNISTCVPKKPILIRKFTQRYQKLLYDTTIPAKESLKDILKKAVYNSKGFYIPYSEKELALFPWVLPDLFRQSERCFQQGIQIIKNVYSNTFSYRRSIKRKVFKALLFCYFLNYTTFSSATYNYEIRKVLNELVKQDPTFQSGMAFLKDCPEIIEANGHSVLTKHFSQGFSASLETIHWPVLLTYSGFVKKAIIDYYYLKSTTPHQLFTFYKEIRVNSPFKDILPMLIGCMIIKADRIKDPKLCEEMRVSFFNELGDPRNSSNSLRWVSVDKKAKEIFLSWLKHTDLDVFFEIISKVTGSSSSDSNMWKYRKDFWEKYIEDMYYTRVFLGPTAANIAKVDSRIKDYGHLASYGGSANKCILMFSIGDYVFIECSHNGKLRIWEIGNQPIPFYEKGHGVTTYYYDDIVIGHCLKDFIHSSPATGSWQNKVREWLHRYCNVPYRWRYYD